MVQGDDAGDLAALGEDGVTIICNHQFQDGHVCRYEIADIPPRWYLLGSLRDLVYPGVRGKVKQRWTGTERVLFFAEGWVENPAWLPVRRPDDLLDIYGPTKNAWDNEARGYRPKYRTTPLKRRREQGGPLRVCTPRSYPVWGLCARCARIRPGPSAWRRLERDVLRVITLAGATGRCASIGTT